MSILTFRIDSKSRKHIITEKENYKELRFGMALVFSPMVS